MGLLPQAHVLIRQGAGGSKHDGQQQDVEDPQAYQQGRGHRLEPLGDLALDAVVVLVELDHRVHPPTIPGQAERHVGLEELVGQGPLVDVLGGGEIAHPGLWDAQEGLVDVVLQPEVPSHQVWVIGEEDRSRSAPDLEADNLELGGAGALDDPRPHERRQLPIPPRRGLDGAAEVRARELVSKHRVRHERGVGLRLGLPPKPELPGDDHGERDAQGDEGHQARQGESGDQALFTEAGAEADHGSLMYRRVRLPA